MNIFGHHQRMNPLTSEYPNLGACAFLSSKGSPTVFSAGRRISCATEEEKEAQIRSVENVQQAYAEEGKAGIRNENMFDVLMEPTKYSSLGQLTAAMFKVGGSLGEICKTC